jgi:hypothetical protein
MKSRDASSCRPSCSLSIPSVQYRTTRFSGSIVFAKIPPVNWATCSSSFKVFFVRPWCTHRSHLIMLFHPREGLGCTSWLHRDGEFAENSTSQAQRGITCWSSSFSSWPNRCGRRICTLLVVGSMLFLINSKTTEAPICLTVIAEPTHPGTVSRMDVFISRN